MTLKENIQENGLTIYKYSKCKCNSSKAARTSLFGQSLGFGGGEVWKIILGYRGKLRIYIKSDYTLAKTKWASLKT